MAKKEALTPNMQKKLKRGTLHPNFRPVTDISTDGSKKTVFMSYKHEELTLETDSKIHQAWTGRFGDTQSSGKAAEFYKKYGELF